MASFDLSNPKEKPGNSPYVKRTGNGALVFTAPVKGKTPRNSSYTRSELRETTRGGDKLNWRMGDGTQRLDGSLSVNAVPRERGKVVFGQIHAVDYLHSPLKLTFERLPGSSAGRVYAQFRTKTGKGQVNVELFRGIALGQKFDYSAVLRQDGRLAITVSSAGKTAVRVLKMSPEWNEKQLYFKVGAINMTEKGSVAEKSAVTYHRLSTTRSKDKGSNVQKSATIASGASAVRPDEKDRGAEKIEKPRGASTAAPNVAGSQGAPSSKLPTMRGFFDAFLPDGRELPSFDLSTGQVSASSSAFLKRTQSGALVFTAPVNGKTTRKSNYTRSELRGTTKDGNKFNWRMRDGTHSLKGSLSVDAVPRDRCGVFFGQIHAVNDIHPPLKLTFQLSPGSKTGTVTAEYRTTPGKSLARVELLRGIALGQKFDYSAVLQQDGRLSLTATSAGQTAVRELEMSPAWNERQLYFKAGAYNMTNKGTDADKSVVTYHSLSTSHPSD